MGGWLGVGCMDGRAPPCCSRPALCTASAPRPADQRCARCPRPARLRLTAGAHPSPRRPAGTCARGGAPPPGPAGAVVRMAAAPVVMVSGRGALQAEPEHAWSAAWRHAAWLGRRRPSLRAPTRLLPVGVVDGAEVAAKHVPPGLRRQRGQRSAARPISLASESAVLLPPPAPGRACRPACQCQALQGSASQDLPDHLCEVLARQRSCSAQPASHSEPGAATLPSPASARPTFVRCWRASSSMRRCMKVGGLKEPQDTRTAGRYRSALYPALLPGRGGRGRGDRH